jgi:hypothetical protein
MIPNLGVPSATQGKLLAGYHSRDSQPLALLFGTAGVSKTIEFSGIYEKRNIL